MALLTLLLLTDTAVGAGFMPLGYLSVSNPESSAPGSSAAGVSADGSVVTGGSWTDESTGATHLEAYRWTAGTGMQSIGSLPVPDAIFTQSYATAVSADGRTIVGETSYTVGSTGHDNGAFRWTEADGMALLAPGFGPPGRAEGVSADGTVITGSWSFQQAYRFTPASGFEFLGPVPNTDFPKGTNGAVPSADGSVLAGTWQTDFNERQAYRWTAATGLVALGDLPGGPVSSFAAGISADGSTVVGTGQVSGTSPALQGLQAFRWTAAGGMVALDHLAGFTESSARAVSGDGSVVVGTTNPFQDGGVAFLWTEGGGTQLLLDVLVAQGATGLDGWTLFDAAAISADGQWIVGTGRGPDGVAQAYRAQLDVSSVPAPPALALLATGLLALAARRPHRK